MNLNGYPRIAIVGCPGSGKSTLAREIAARTGHPVVHLDFENWQPGWVPTPKEAFAARQRERIQAERWIIDGNYNGTMELRFAAADLVIVLDLPRLLCAGRVIRRHGTPRPDMPPGVEEGRVWSLDFLRFLLFIFEFKWFSRPKILRLHRKYPQVGFMRLRTRKAVRALLG